MKYDFKVFEVSREYALELIQKYHYSNTLPRINKHFVGFFLNDELVGVVTLGYGTRPEHTIKKLFPTLDTNDYLEIGRMAMTEAMPKNSETQMLSALCKWIKKNCPNVKVLFTWADGMLGKCGYVYQAASFTYAGKSLTDIYLKDGVKIHPRQTRLLFATSEDDTRLTVRPSLEQMTEQGIEHYRGYQYKYFRFLCSKSEKRRLLKTCAVDLSTPPPKDKDLVWQVQDKRTGEWIASDKPPYREDKRFCESPNENQLKLF